MSSMTTRATRLLNEAKNFIESGEEANWAASERMWQANKEEGTSLRDIAKRVGFKAASTVWVWVAIWDRYGDRAPEQRPSFTDAYKEFAGDPSRARDAEADRVARDKPERMVEAITKAPPESRKAIFEAITKEQALNQEMEAVQSKHWKQAAQRSQDIGRENDPPGTIYFGDFAHGYARLGAAEEKLREALASLRRTDLTGEHRSMVTTKIQGLRLLLDWLDSYAESGHGDAAELDALLGGEIS